MIELFGNWKIDVDSMAYTLKKVVNGTSKKGEPIVREDIKGYYGTFEGALKALGKEIVKDKLKDGPYTLTEALNVVREARETVERLIEQEVGDVWTGN